MGRGKIASVIFLCKRSPEGQVLLDSWPDRMFKAVAAPQLARRSAGADGNDLRPGTEEGGNKLLTVDVRVLQGLLKDRHDIVYFPQIFVHRPTDLGNCALAGNSAAPPYFGRGDAIVFFEAEAEIVLVGITAAAGRFRDPDAAGSAQSHRCLYPLFDQ